MDRLALVGLLSALGCSFTGAIPAPSSDAGLQPDASEVVDAKSGIDGPLLSVCAPQEGLGGCWEFENNLNDSSGNGNDGIGVNAPIYGAGVNGFALLLEDGDQGVELAEQPSLEGPAITIEAHINPTALPPGATERIVFDNEAQYAMGLAGNGGAFRCVGAGGPFNNSAADVISINTWYHVACVIDATRNRMFVNGDEIACRVRAAEAETGGTIGSAIGFDRQTGANLGFFTGLIDNMRIFTVARTAADICAAAGRSDCIEIAAANCVL